MEMGTGIRPMEAMHSHAPGVARLHGSRGVFPGHLFGTAKRSSQRLLASEAAAHPEWILASLDIDKAFLKGLTYKELAEATGEPERMVYFTLPPGSAAILRQFPGYEDFDEAIHCLRCVKPGTGTKDAPRAFSLKLRNHYELRVKRDLIRSRV